MTITSPFKEGAVIQIAQGVLRGVGPMGPRGHTGAAGPVGPQGPIGPQPTMDPVGALYTTSTLADINTAGTWQAVPFTGTSYTVGAMSVLTSADGTIKLYQANENGTTVLFTAAIAVSPAAASSEPFRFEIGLFTPGASTPFAMATHDHENLSASSTFTSTFQGWFADETSITVKVRVAGASNAPRISFASLGVARTGGTTGPQGPQGVQGPTGSSGPAGPPGDSGTGYSTMDALDSVGDSDTLPAGSSSNTQGLAYPTGPMRPAFPAYIKNLADTAAKRVVRRFNDATAAAAATDREIGQLAYLLSNNSLQLITSSGGTPVPTTVAQVGYGTTDPPAGTYPAGYLYLKVV